jgi:hypothetical protein
VIGREGPGPERPGPDYPPEWDDEPEGECPAGGDHESQWLDDRWRCLRCGEPFGEPDPPTRAVVVPDPWQSQGPVPPPPF